MFDQGLEFLEQQQQQSLIPLSGVGYMDQITP